MTVPRLLLVPTHRTGLANAVAAALAEISTAQGRRVRFHHLGPLGPGACWDRWEGASFLDPGLYDQETLFGLYDVATRGAQLSLLSSTQGILDRRDGVDWVSADVAILLDSPVVLVLDCRKWGTGIGALAAGIKAARPRANIAAAVLTGVGGRDHCSVLREALAEAGVPVAGCLFEGDGPGWDAEPPGAWGLPLAPAFLEAVSRQVDVAALVDLAGQRGFLAAPGWLKDRGGDGPLVMVAGGGGFTPWSRDSIEMLRAAGAQIKRLDLLEDPALPAQAAGLVLAGTVWPSSLPDISMNQPLLRDLATRIGDGLPTLALGGGMLLLLSRIQDSLGRTVDLAGVVPGDGEILWDLDEAAYVEVTAARDNLLMSKGQQVKGWVMTDAEVLDPTALWDPPLTVRGAGIDGEQGEGVGTDTLLCSRVLVHLASAPAMSTRFVRACAAYAAAHLWP
jgi:cobyrinic acid a,c-diamide synthase